MLYKFTQNNSGGTFVTNDKLCEIIIIEADNEEEACDIGLDLGIYFNGVDSGYDCECCGDRWYTPSEITFPYKRSKEKTIKDLEEYIEYIILGNNNTNFFWGRTTRIFFSNGEVKEFNF